MDWPRHRIEARPPSTFRPPHCPWPQCDQHHRSRNRRFRYHRAGSYVRKCDRRRVPRFLCLACLRTFSRQSFATSYYLKRPELLVPIAAGLQAGSAHRQIARSLGCAPSTVTRLAARLGRHALLLQALALEHLPEIPEPVVFDHFETFVVCQDDALGIGTPVGQRSWFVYGVDPAPHRRGGRRSPAQQRRARRRAAPARGAVLHSTRRSLDGLLRRIPPGATLDLVTDGHPAYRRVLAVHPARGRVRHRAYPNPERGPKGSRPSPEARVRDREMFPVDLLHSLWRHTHAHHRRETLAFGRRTNAVLERAFLMTVWRNFVKGRSERAPDPTTPGMAIGLTDRPWSWERVLARRLFPGKIVLPPGWARVYRRLWVTSAIGRNTVHDRVNAF